MITFTPRPSLLQFRGSRDVSPDKPNPSKQITEVSSSADRNKGSDRDAYVRNWQPDLPIQPPSERGTRDTFSTNISLNSPEPKGHLELPVEDPDEALKTRLAFMENWIKSQSPPVSETSTVKHQKARPVVQNPARFIANALAGGKPDADRKAKVKALEQLAKDNGEQNR